MSTKKIGLGCAVMVALGASAAAAEPLRLDAAALDQVVAGIAITGIEVFAQAGPDAENFSRSRAGLTFGHLSRGSSASATVNCTDCTSAGTLAIALLINDLVDDRRLRDVLADEGFDLPVPDGQTYSGYSIAAGGFNELLVGAFSPTGEAEADGKVRPLVQEPFLSATVGYGVGRTSGDGTVGMTGVVEQGQGVGTGAAIRTPLGRTVLLGVAVAVDPGALVPNTN